VAVPLTKALQHGRTLGALRIAVRLSLVSLAVAAALVRAGGASAATPCWKALLNDWYDGRIDNTYEVHCYRDALKHLPADVQTYSSAHDDILRALQSAVAKEKKAGHTVGPNTPLTPPSGGSGGSGGTGTTGGTTTSPPIGRKPDKGIGKVADKLNPNSADSLPVPLLVLGALAILLVLAGGAGLIAKQIQARKQAP